MNKFARIVPVTRNAYLRAGVAAGTALASMGAFAQASDPFDDAISDITTKVGSYGAALVGLAAVAVVFYVAIKFVKKIPKAA